MSFPVKLNDQPEIFTVEQVTPRAKLGLTEEIIPPG
jgi:hypothetical protein